jgi:hypothetical protein
LAESVPALTGNSSSDTGDMLMAELSNSAIVENNSPQLRLYKAMPIEKIPLKMFQRMQMDISRQFNMGNLRTVVHLVNKCTHNRSIFRLKNPAEKFESVGTDALVTFYDSLLHVFPDGIITMKKIKTYRHEQFYIIREKVEFTGTEFSKEVAQSIFCPTILPAYGHQANYMDVAEEEKEKFRALEESILQNGRKIQVSNKAVMTFYIDIDANRIVLSDLNYKVVSIRAV